MKPAVLLMAYGTPRSLDDVEAYYTHIRRGRPPSPEALNDLVARYRAIGGRSPLLEITGAQAAALQHELEMPVFVGQKHATPFIPDAFGKIAETDVDHCVGLVLAPHFSTMSIGDYERRARAAATEAAWNGTFTMVTSWHLEPGYIELLSRRVGTALGSLEARAEEAVVIFTAHSLPTAILERNDPYPDQLRESAEAVASAAGLERWTIAWQSAGATSEEWIGPDLLEVLEKASADGASGVVVCPCGFVADHLEVLYDVDIEAAGRASELGIALARTASPNADPDFIATLAAVVRKTLASG